MTNEEIDQELDTKAIVIRDGARGWRLGSCFIEDAQDILGVDDGETPSEDDEDYGEIIDDLCRICEELLNGSGYTVVWNDGYVIYQDLSDEAIESLAEGF